MTPLGEILANVEQLPDAPGCWLWTGTLQNPSRRGAGGYGVLRGRLHVFAHRASYEASRGPIPAGMVLDHLCRVPSCVNPAHLEPVTHRENCRRGLRGRLRTACPKGHPLDGVVRRSSGREQRYCKTCNRVNVNRIHALRRAGEVS